MTQTLLYSLRRAALWLKRSKHNNGHGIHSPYLFRMVEFVTSHELSYYPLERLLTTLQPSSHNRRTLSLLYRAIAYLKPASVEPLGSITESELLVARTALTCQQKYATLYLVNEEPPPSFTPLAKEIIIVTDTHRNPSRKRCAQRLIASMQPRTVIDFTDITILLFDPALHPQHYRLNP